MHPVSSQYKAITHFGTHGGSDHTTHNDLMGGRTAITTEALGAYNNLRAVLDLPAVRIEDVGRWAFSAGLTNNTTASDEDVSGVGLWYAMQGAKVGWIADAAFKPQLLADLQRTARLGEPDDVLQMAREVERRGFIDHLITSGGVEAFINTLKMEPHFGGWMHSRAHGWLPIEAGAIAHDVNHLTVLSHDQSQPFMNDTFDWPQWPALEVPHDVVINYFQSMVTLSDPTSENASMKRAKPKQQKPREEQDSASENDYGTALELSLLFYEANRSGDLNEATNRVTWRGDSGLRDGRDGVYFGDVAEENLQDGLSLDLSGGYHDAGDHVKFGLPLASTLSTLAWGGLSFRKGYVAAGQLEELLDTVRWGTDYLLKAHGTNKRGRTSFFVAQVGDGDADHALWSAPEDQSIARPAMAVTADKPGSDVAAASAAAMAAASVLFHDNGDKAYSKTLYQNAKSLFTFAKRHLGKYSDAIKSAQPFYNSLSGFQDELAYGAAWLARAAESQGKNGDAFRKQAIRTYNRKVGGLNNGWTHNWDDASYATAVLLAGDAGHRRARRDVRHWLNSWVKGSDGVAITDGGLRYIDQWGSLRYAANTALLAGITADSVMDPGKRYSKLATGSIDYILGDNPRNSSYVVGYGVNSPQQPHHRAASGIGWDDFNSDQPNKHVLNGALVGGPAKADDFAYDDRRSNYISNEVAIDYNAGFTGALAYLIQL